MLGAAALDAHVAASRQVLPSFSAGDCWLVCLPFTSIGALAAIWRVYSTGGCLALLDRGFDAAEARALMARGVSHVSLVPAMLDALADADAPAPRGLRCVLSGGGPLSRAQATRAHALDWPLWQGWGMTETASHVAAGPVDLDWAPGVVGRPLPGVTIDSASGEAPLRIAGPMLMSGYAQAGLAPGMGLDEAGRLLTGDAGQWLPDGRLRILGRADGVIVTGGVNVHPEEIEARFADCSGAGEVAVTARPDPRWGSVLVALYPGSADAATLADWAREALPGAWRPREFRRVAALPRNAMGKLLRAELPGLLR
jgi:O-succinylbenzoic acid--CoA ligase